MFTFLRSNLCLKAIDAKGMPCVLHYLSIVSVLFKKTIMAEIRS